MDPDSDSPIFVIDLQDANKKFFACTFWKYIYISFQREKVIKKSQNSKNSSFLTMFAWWWKDPDPGGPKTYGPGSATQLKKIPNELMQQGP